MRKKKKIPIKYGEERVVLSDTLPYEIPLIFSNRYFYKFLREKKENEEIFKILFPNLENLPTKPFRFRIRHKHDDFRELAIVHPSAQREVMRFYNEFKSLILYYSTISPFSIRKPVRVARYSFFNDILHKQNRDGSFAYSQIEQDDSEYENLKTFFTYRKYSNIFKFYESYTFHRCEKKYNYLLKADVSKCFDSIYTHTLAWAIYNKEIVKENLGEKGIDKTFPGKFDKMMQRLNENETNGIVIGPEFSRIFAELILQRIDKNISERLQKGGNLYHKRDYEIFRYVDDYFIFYNNEMDKSKILKEFKLALKEYHFSMNELKSINYEKPIITGITIAKQKISDLFHENLKLVIEKADEKTNEEDKIKENESVYFSSNEAITRFKVIIKETGVEYDSIMNYSLAALDNKIKKMIKQWSSDNVTKNVKKQFEKGFLEILDVAFFLYSVGPRVNSTIKLCLIISKILCFLKKNKTNKYREPLLEEQKQNVLKKIYDEICFALQKNKMQSEVPIETLYLLITLRQLGRGYRLSSEVLCSYFGIQSNPDTKTLKIENELNYFSIVVLLYYINDILQYAKVKEILKQHILEKFKVKKDIEWRKDTELVFLLLDTLSCPFLNEPASSNKYGYKKKLLNLLNIEKNHAAIIGNQKFWFVKWLDFDFGMELEAKRSQEVY